MVIELNINEFEKVKELFENKYQIPAVSVLNGDFPGKVFVDNREEPQIALVFPLSRWSYISAKNINKLSNKEFIKSLFEEKILPLIKETKENRFEIYGSDDEDWDKVLNESLGEYIIQKHYENTYVLNKEKFDICCKNIPKINDLNIVEKKYAIIPEKYKKFTLNKNADKWRRWNDY